jgi:single-stranded-DNA-specific exonuclease
LGPEWIKKEDQRAESSDTSVAGKYGLPSVISNLLNLRGFKSEEQIKGLLNPKLSELKDPFSLKNMQVASQRLLAAFKNNETVCIYADFDLDGTSGLALLVTGFKQLGFKNLIAYQPKRLSEGYGFHSHAVEDLKKQGVSVIVTVDVGITSLDAALKAKELGIDVILTDHHLPGEKLPEVFTLINPNVPGDSSNLGYLCGAGVGFYLLRALKRTFNDELGEDSVKNVDLKSVLEFFTIATLTDMVPLVGDNRVLIKHGLMQIQNTQKPGLRALLDELEMSDRPLTSSDVAIRFAPKLNALSRMESGVLPRDIFLCDDVVLSKKLVQDILKNNKDRVQLQSDAEKHAIDEVTRNWQNKDFVYVASQTYHRGVIGLIATKLAQVFNVPTYVGSVDLKEGTIVGSARVPAGQEHSLVEAMQQAQHLAQEAQAKTVLNRFGGHAAAAGFEMHIQNHELFVHSLAQYYKNLKEVKKPRVIEYDAEIEIDHISDDLMKWYDFVGPYGVGFDIPIFKISNLRLIESKELRGGHIKLKFKSAYAIQMEALLFSPSQRQKSLILQEHGDYDVLGELQWNYFAGRKSIQILVRDLKEKV